VATSNINNELKASAPHYARLLLIDIFPHAMMLRLVICVFQDEANTFLFTNFGQISQSTPVSEFEQA